MPRGQHSRRHREIGSGLAVVAAGLCIGCASVDPKPFADFSGSIREVRSGADAALQYGAEESRRLLIRRIVEAAAVGDNAAITSLRLAVDPDQPLQLDPKQIPSFLEGRWFRSGVFALNSSLADYAELLHALAQPELVPRETFEQLASDLNGNVSAALKALKQDADPRQIALFSTASAGLTRAALECQRRHRLARAIEENQGAVATIALHGRDAVQIAAVELAENYRDNAQEVLQTLASSPTTAAAESLIAIDEEYVARLDILRALDSSYAALPEAHRELRAAVANPGIRLESIRALSEEGVRLQQLHSELGASAGAP